MNIEYCLMCDKNVTVNIVDKKKKYQDDQINIEYDGKVAKCPICGEELFNDYVNEYNRNQIKKQYEIENKIITIDEIQQILVKYNIGKRPLSLLLGFGEITITRYIDGYVPTIKNSILLKTILDSPSDYYSILQMNKNNIKPTAFNKSEETTRKLLDINQEDKTITEVSKYIINKTDVTNLSLQKILYYVQMFYMALFNKHAFNSKCSAWQYGPVFGCIYYKYKSFGKCILESEDDSNIECEDLKKVVDYVIKYFGCYNGPILKEFTHKEKPWLESCGTESQIIEKSSMKKYGQEILEKYNINDITEIYKYSEFMFKNR